MNFTKKIKKAEKAVTIMKKYCSEIKNLINLKSVEYLYNKIKVKGKFNISKYNEIISYIEYKESIDVDNEIKKLINEFSDFHKYEEEYDSILEIEKMQ